VPTVSDSGSDPKLTPELALAYLGELSTDIRAAAVLDGDGSIAAQSGFQDDDAEQVRSLVGDLFDKAAEAAAKEPAPGQVEVALPDGSVFALREHGWTLAVVAGRFALSSLMFFDLRMVIRDLAGLPQGATS
jgi:predicted regulator of Ras-like GTPase activity (Roadblock/LC7/MglB family)